MTERRLLGWVEVDSGTLLIGDPVYVLPRASEDKAGVDYQAVIDAPADLYAQPLAERPVLLLQRFGGDGSFPVVGEFAEGELIAVHIDLDPPMDEDDEEA